MIPCFTIGIVGIKILLKEEIKEFSNAEAGLRTKSWTPEGGN